MINDYNFVTDTEVTLSVVLGTAVMPIHQLLRLGRGATIELETPINSDVIILANGKPFARAQIQSQQNDDDQTLNVTIQKFSEMQK